MAQECAIHEFVCEHCDHEFDPDDLRFSCHEKTSKYSFYAVLNLFLAALLISNLVDNNFGLFLLPFFSSDLPVLNYSVFQYLENYLHGRTSEENLNKIRRAKIRSMLGPTPQDIKQWNNSITLGAFLIYGVHKGAFDNWWKGIVFWGAAVFVSKVVRFLVGQWLGIVVFPGISRGFMKLSILYVYFKFPSDTAFKTLYGIDYIAFRWMFGQSVDYFFRIVTWAEVVGAICNYLFLPYGLCLTEYVCSSKRGHYCCVCEEFKKEKCRNCGFIANN